MSAATELEELLASPEVGWSAIRAEGRIYRDIGLSRRALEERRGAGGRRERIDRMMPKLVAAGSLGARTDRWRLWRGGSVFLRSEYMVGHELVTVVVQGPRWWRWSQSLGTTSGGGPGRPVRYLVGPPAALLDAPALFACLEIQDVRRSRYANRSCFEVTTTPIEQRPRNRIVFREAGPGADEYQLAVDAERGVLLAIRAQHHGDLFQAIEVESIAFDEELEPSLFSLDDDTVGSSAVARLSRRLSIEEVGGQVDFTLVVPEPSPSSVAPHVALFEGDRRGLGPTRVVVTYVVAEEGRRGQLRLTEYATAPPTVSEAWEVEGELLVAHLRQEAAERIRVRTMIGGTCADLESSVLGRERLVDLARSLVPLG